jgi:hypothetical protein
LQDDRGGAFRHWQPHCTGTSSDDPAEPIGHGHCGLEQPRYRQRLILRVDQRGADMAIAVERRDKMPQVGGPIA